jgi:hypothetical protein
LKADFRSKKKAKNQLILWKNEKREKLKRKWLVANPNLLERKRVK